MKILVVCQHFYPEQFRINDICFELVKRGHDVTVLTGLPNYPKGKVLDEYRFFQKRKQVIEGVKVRRATLIGRGKSLFKMALNYLSFAAFGSLKAAFMPKDFDLIYVYQLSPITMALPAIVIKRMANVPLIIHVLDQWPISVTTGPIKKTSFIYKWLEKLSIWIYKEADWITISSKSFAKYFTNELKLAKKEYGFTYLPSYAESTYAKLKNLKHKTFNLVFAGNIGPAQSVETIVEAARILSEHKDIKFHIVGDGLSREACENLSLEYNLSNITFYGYFDVSVMPQFYSLADAFLITMVDNEVVNATLPAKVQSYMLAGKPIVGAISGEVKAVIDEAKCGLCVESLNYKGLAKMILKLKNSPEKRIEMGKNGKNYYQEHFAKDKCLTDMENVFKEVVSKRKQVL